MENSYTRGVDYFLNAVADGPAGFLATAGEAFTGNRDAGNRDGSFRGDGERSALAGGGFQM